VKTTARSGGLLLPLVACFLLGALAVAVGAPVLPCPECERIRFLADNSCVQGSDYWHRLLAGCPTCAKTGRVTALRRLSFR
jgi:hypothetical protein